MKKKTVNITLLTPFSYSNHNLFEIAMAPSLQNSTTANVIWKKVNKTRNLEQSNRIISYSNISVLPLIRGQISPKIQKITSFETKKLPNAFIQHVATGSVTIPVFRVYQRHTSAFIKTHTVILKQAKYFYIFCMHDT